MPLSVSSHVIADHKTTVFDTSKTPLAPPSICLGLPGGGGQVPFSCMVKASNACHARMDRDEPSRQRLPNLEKEIPGPEPGSAIWNVSTVITNYSVLSTRNSCSLGTRAVTHHRAVSTVIHDHKSDVAIETGPKTYQS